ncbi:MAG: protein kinase [Labilithrix sp.]|nr:protein kinase [Labilithrix sp.]MCW5816343.1 protein kinase [Labilithrix sp.]
MPEPDALAAARALLAAGDVDGAVRGFLRQRAFDEAAKAYASKGRYLDGANMLMDAIGVGVSLVGGLDPQRKALAGLAAELFALGKDVDTSTKLFNALGDPRGRAQADAGIKDTGRMAAFRLEREGRAEEALVAYQKLRQLPDAARVAEGLGRVEEAGRIYEEAAMPFDAARCWLALGDPARTLDALLRVPREHADYRKACVQALRIALDLNVLDFRVDQFLSRFVKDGPQADGELESFYMLGKVYAQRDFAESAAEVYEKLAAFRPGYRDVEQKLAALRSDLRGSTRAYEAIVREDAGFQGRALTREVKPANALPDLPDLPELEGLPPLPGAAAPAPAPAQATRRAGGGEATMQVEARAVPAPAAVAPTAAGSPDSAFADLPIGSTVSNGRYVVEKLIGQGGMAAVYRVKDEELGETVALKMFFMQSDATLLHRFKQEVTLSRQLNHPNIVRLYDIGSHGEYKFLTMELLDGQDLRSILDEGKPEIAVALKYLSQACAGLAVAHERGVIHRDLKPENLFVTRDGTLKVMDFGIAKKQTTASSVTQAGMIMGTPLYMSPEQIQDFGSVSHLSDLYSLGIIAYELFTGAVPFQSEDMLNLFFMHYQQEPAPPRDKAPEIPDELEDIILRLLAKDPTKRIQSCRELGSLLAEIRPRPARARTITQR